MSDLPRSVRSEEQILRGSWLRILGNYRCVLLLLY
jgi:hypothetical protein